ncbi:unnamed protein product, partial [Didymodactylos carnosus]
MCGYFHLYHTGTPKHDYYDCLYSTMELMRDGRSIVPYCRRPLPTLSLPMNVSTCYGKELTFGQLKLLNITVYDLFEWNTPLDTMTKYQNYLTGMSGKNEIFCNCSINLNSFGSFCEYTFNFHQPSFELLIALMFVKQSLDLKLNVRLYKDYSLDNITCYMGLKCGTFLCLDWRHICNGLKDCPNGEDEINCLELELNECDPEQEYRCRSGMCIDKVFAFDLMTNDCSDESDETFSSQPESCISKHSILCDERNCAWLKFPCDDGECDISPLGFGCSSKRTTIFAALAYQLPFDADLCSKYILCEVQVSLLYNKTQCLILCPPKGSCYPFLDQVCSTYYFLPTNSFLYPSVRFLHLTQSYSSIPDYICYDYVLCQSFPPTVLIDDKYSCRHLTEFNFTFDAQDDLVLLYRELILILSFCSSFISSNCSSELLFHCPISNKCISKYRVKDGYSDCHMVLDELYVDMCSLNLTRQHFKCRDQQTNESACVNLRQQYISHDNKMCE